MNSDKDLKELWARQPVAEKPDIKELSEKIAGLKKKNMMKLVFANVSLILTAIFMCYCYYAITNIVFTTRLGLMLIMLAIFIYLAVYNQDIPLLRKTDVERDVNEHLRQMIRLKEKHFFMMRTVMNIYFILLSVGICLYMAQFSFSPIKTIVKYGLTLGWIGFAYFYIRPRKMKKQQAEFSEIINKLETLKGQMAA